jgi:hypothetical protein
MIRATPATHAPMQQAVAGYWGGPVIYPGDQDLANQARGKAPRTRTWRPGPSPDKHRLEGPGVPGPSYLRACCVRW